METKEETCLLGIPSEEIKDGTDIDEAEYKYGDELRGIPTKIDDAKFEDAETRAIENKSVRYEE